MPDYTNPHGRRVHPDADSDHYVNAERYSFLYANVATVRDSNTIVERYRNRAANGYADCHHHKDSDIHTYSYYHHNTNGAAIEYADAGRDQHADPNTDPLSDSERNQHANADGDYDGNGNPDTSSRCYL